MNIFTQKEKYLLSISLFLVILSNFIGGKVDLLTLLAAIIGVTAVLLCAKGHVYGQILIAIFSLLYGVISYQFHYYGEMMTYVGMAFPMALWSLYTWYTNPSKENPDEVEINQVNSRNKIIILVSSIVVTMIFYYILKYFHTPNLFFSTLSITTSFIAASLTMLRSSYYGLFYASNDLVLIILWILASLKDPIYIAVVVNFMVFLVNDLYGFYSWLKRERKQKHNSL